MRPHISITGHVRPSVRRSVRRSVGRSVALKNNGNQHFRDIVRGGILGPLDASQHLYKTVQRSISQSSDLSVDHS